MNRKYLTILFIFSFSFTLEKQIYSTVQMMDQVQIINPNNLQIEQTIMTEFADENNNCMAYDSEMTCSMAGCEWVIDMCIENTIQDALNTPHFVALDEINGYWFTTTIASGYVAQFSLLDNSLIDTYFVGDAPALLVLDTTAKILYCSRMMPMNGMGNMMPSGESTIIQSLYYSGMGLSQGYQYEIDSPSPHGLAINHDGSEVYTASNTADWLYKINIETGDITGVVMDLEVNNTPDQTTQRLKPIQCLSVGNKLFVSCSAGTWMNPWTGQQIIIPGKLQMWNSDTMELIDTYDFGDYSSPWHIKESPFENKVYIALSGDNLYDTEGVASLIYTDSELSLEWEVVNDNFEILHGIDVSSNGENIYVTGRGDGHIHKLDLEGNYIDNIFLGSMSMLGGIAIEKKGLPELGDLNNDSVIDVIDVVLGVNIIFNPMNAGPYLNFSSDINTDSITNVVDIVLMVNIILN